MWDPYMDVFVPWCLGPDSSGGQGMMSLASHTGPCPWSPVPDEARDRDGKDGKSMPHLAYAIV